MDRAPFLETNVFVPIVTRDEPNHSPRATAFFDRIRQVKGTDAVVVCEKRIRRLAMRSNYW
jgi:predicted nucleic acid-binding protein